MKELTILLICSLFSLTIIQAQTDAEIERMKKAVPRLPHKTNPTHFFKSSRTEIQYFFSGLFIVYKNFISSQDGQSCSFTPSCSEYGMLSVKKKGLIKGVPAIFDRLMRCHGLAPELYKKDVKTGLLMEEP